MAESAVSFLVEKLSFLLEEEVKLLTGFREDVVFVKDELESMRAFLRAADAVEDEDEGIKVWVKQVREVAFDAEDILDEYLYRFADQHQRRKGFYGSLFKIAHRIKGLKSRHQIASELQAIKSRVSEISYRRQRYQYKPKIMMEEGASPSYGTKRASHELRRDDARLLQESQLVGIENPKKELVALLFNDQVSSGQVVAVAGMGGLGKTTLVNQVYRDAAVKQRFQHRAWITVSQSYNLHDLLAKIVKQLYEGIARPVPNTDSMDILSLKEVIIDFLGNGQYLIVLDDLWSVDSWDDLKNAFRVNRNLGSRLIVTTRNFGVASTITKDLFGGNIFCLKALSSKESWDLLRARTFRGNPCPSHLEEICERILKRCMGLPLAIVTIGGVLATKNTSKLNEWEMVSRNLGPDNGDKLKNMNKILLLSFNDLPYQLKSCLLYLSLFPEDSVYVKSYIVRLWTAEGFVQVREDATPEDVAELYFNELCNRSLIQVAEEEVDEELNGFQVHDLVREIILQKSKDQNFAATMRGENVMLLENNIRYLSVPATLENLQGDCSFSRLRSLIILPVKGSISGNPIPIFFSKCGGLRLLNVLNCSGLTLDTFPKCITKLYNLRLLNLSGTKVASIPRSIGRLQNLETLDLGKTLVEELPIEILQLHRIRHIKAFRIIIDGSPIRKIIGVSVPTEIGNLTSLQTLLKIHARKGCGIELIRCLGNLKQLRELCIGQLEADNGPALCSMLGKLNQLLRLEMETTEEDELLDVQNVSPPPQRLRSLYMSGRLEMPPHWVLQLSSLVELRLRWSRLQADALESLGALPNLQLLYLAKAYDGEELCFKAGGFQMLKDLRFFRLGKVAQVKVEEGAMPRLERLWFDDCKLLEEVSSGIEFLTLLNEVVFVNMSDQFLTRLYSGVKHVPNVIVASRDA